MAGERRALTPAECEKIDALARVRTSGTLYDLLGVPPDAPADAIDRAFHGLAREWHPDRFYSRDTGEFTKKIEDNFTLITKAFQTLRDPNRRAAYNREVKIEVKPAAPTAPTGHEVHLKPAAPPPPPPPPPRHKATAAVDKIRQQLSERLARAAQYHEAGVADFAAGKYVKAESALYLAVQFDPKNPTYQQALAKATSKAKELRAGQYIHQAEQEESYQRIKEAIALYMKAVECDPPDGVAYFKLANLVRAHDQDDRAALTWLRKAAQKEPTNVTYRMALAEMYEKLGMASNALREVSAALEADPKNEAARAAMKRIKK